MSKNNQITKESIVNDCFSLFDEQFTIADFTASIERANQESNEVLDSARTAIKKALCNDTDEDTKYVVDMGSELRDKIEKGEVKLVHNSDGYLFAQLRQGNGRYGKKLAIKEELQEERISADALQLALQMDAIKTQLDTIISTMQEIEGRVADVIQGQRNDRVGLFYSGLSLYYEAKTIKDDVLKKQITAQSLKAISDANSQMIQDIRSSIQYLITEQYQSEKNSMQHVDEHISIIKQCYDIVYRASFLKAEIYQENGEIESMLTALDEYGRFVANMIAPYVGKLSELDKDSVFIEKGTWGTIANTLTGCNELKKMISGNEGYLLSLGGNQNG
ncbi:hypothetical protein [Aminicella lysinilytica]|uniref:Uncharacterized protein n=1 Tax=Aminicella lysinilytica TaxID=433323 RepID=A0A4R6Q352_9FIRM|nr:hypothetical protein [Aminicella lysinilytica]TDP53705.1 hypothetical protein EV211_12320 [Aminicella lysinilytica]